MTPSAIKNLEASTRHLLFLLKLYTKKTLYTHVTEKGKEAHCPEVTYTKYVSHCGQFGQPSIAVRRTNNWNKISDQIITRFWKPHGRIALGTCIKETSITLLAVFFSMVCLVDAPTNFLQHTFFPLTSNSQSIPLCSCWKYLLFLWSFFSFHTSPSVKSMEPGLEPHFNTFTHSVNNHCFVLGFALQA